MEKDFIAGEQKVIRLFVVRKSSATDDFGFQRVKTAENKVSALSK